MNRSGQQSLESSRWRILIVLCVALALLTNVRLQSGDSLRPDRRTNGESTIAAASLAAERAWSSTVQVLNGNEVAALGTIVSESGFVLTKASEMAAIIRVRLPCRCELDAEVAGIDGDLDIAMLRLPVAGLIPVEWADYSTAELGEWVLAPGQERRTWMGVVGALSRPIRREGGALGVQLRTSPREEGEGAIITRVFAKSAAEAAGLKAGDVIRFIDDSLMTTTEQVIERIQRSDPGETVKVKIDRDGVEMELQITLGYRSIFDAFDRNQLMSGETSSRRAGFKEIIQHTIPLDPNAMGGPLVSLEGKVIGINIARVDRVTTYALPVQVVRDVLQESMLLGDQ